MPTAEAIAAATRPNADGHAPVPGSNGRAESNGRASAHPVGDDPADWPGLRVDLDRFRRDLRPMCDRVAAWAARHADKVRAVYADAEYVKVTFLIVTGRDQFDFDLARAEAALGRKLARDFPIGHVETFQSPTAAGGALFNSQRARRIYGDG